MVFSNVPKLHALVGLLAATAAFPAGCSNDDFEGCEASRTCKPKHTGGASGTGSETGGESGNDTGGRSGTSSGGASGSGTGQSGEAGATDGGRGGAGDDTTRPTIISITPDDGDTEVERDVEIAVTFSEPIDESTVTRRSAVLTGPDGDVTGTLGVDGRVVTFVAEKPLYLLGDYVFTVGDGVADLAGNTLGEEASVGWKVRDGRWSEPTYPFGKTVPRVVKQFQRNAAGDAVVGIEVWPTRDAIYGSVFVAGDNEWTTLTELHTKATLQDFTYGVGIDSYRRAVVTWTGYMSAGSGWSRRNDDGVWVNAGSLGSIADVVTTPGGLAAVAWIESGDLAQTRSLDLSDGVVSPQQPFSMPGSTVPPHPVASLEKIALVGTRAVTGGVQLDVSWKTTSGWESPEPLATASEIGSLGVDSDEQGNIIVVWRQNDEIWSRFYDAASEQWTRRQFVASTPPNGIVLPPDITSGNAIVAFNTFDPDPGTWAAIYLVGVGWVEDGLMRLDSEWAGGAVGVSIDARGLALATWHDEFKYRRYVPGDGWQSPSSLELNVNGYYQWAAGSPDGSILCVGNDVSLEGQGGNNDEWPWAIRFE